MPDNVFVEEETEADAEVIRAGEAAVGVIMQTFENWLKIGHALDVGRRTAMRIAYTNRPRGANYNAAFAQWLTAHPQLNRINTATRSWLYKCLEHEVEILEWLEANEDFKPNYPQTVFNRWSLSTQQAATTAPPSGLRVEIERLRQENADLQRRLNEALDVSGRYDGPSMTRRGSAANIVRVLREWLNPNHLRRVGEGLIHHADTLRSRAAAAQTATRAQPTARAQPAPPPAAAPATRSPRPPLRRMN